VTLTPTSGSPFAETTITVTFTKVTHDNSGNAGEKGHGARKVTFYAAAHGATTCAATPSMPAAGTQHGFAVLNITGHDQLNVTVPIKGAPSATHNFYVQLAPGPATARTPST